MRLTWGWGTRRGVAVFGLGSLQSGFEDDLLALVGPAIEAAGGICVGDVLGDDLQAGPLGIQRCGRARETGDELDHKLVQDGLPVMARRSFSSAALTNCDSTACCRLFWLISTISCSRLTVLPSRLTASA